MACNDLTPSSMRRVTEEFLSELAMPEGTVLAEYIWIGGNQELRSKTKTLTKKPRSVADLPEWNYDGSSTMQAEGRDSEVLLRPRAVFRDPFRRGDNVLVMCDTWLPNGQPHATNTRVQAEKIFEAGKEHKPWFGWEQEFAVMTTDGRMLGWPKMGYPAPQGQYYCGVGAANVPGRELLEAHIRACLYAGIQVSGINAEVLCGQWEYQVGPVLSIAIGDQVWISRWILHRLSELYGCVVSFDPKPIPGDWNGSGAHTNFSTEATRAEGGMSVILDMMKKLEATHKEHIAQYGAGNERRLTGLHETSAMDKFSYAIANRGSSIRVPRETEKNGCGYFEDRRPASSADPYVVGSLLVKTCCL